jgi:hypothetical protein
MFISDPNSFHPGSASKNLSILKKVYKLSEIVYDPGFSSRIPDPDFLPIPDPVVKKARDPGSATLVAR